MRAQKFDIAVRIGLLAALVLGVVLSCEFPDTIGQWLTAPLR